MSATYRLYVASACVMVAAGVLMAVPVGAAAAASGSPTPGLFASAYPTPSAPGSPVPGIIGPGLSPVPVPEPSDDPSQSQGADTSGGGCGLFNIGCQIASGIDSWFGGLARSALQPVLRLIGTTLLSAPNPAADGRVHMLWASVLVIANTLYLLVVIAAGVVVMAHESVQTRYGIKEIAPRLVVAIIASNASLLIIGIAVRLTNALAAALMSQRVSAQGLGNLLRGLILSPMTVAAVGSGAATMVVILLGLVVAVLGVVLLVSYVMRTTLLVLLTIAAPLALCAHGLPYTDGLARAWWRALAACLGIQLGQTLTLITAVEVFLDPHGVNLLGLPTGSGFVDLLVGGCLFVVLLRIPGWGARMAFGSMSRGGSLPGRLMKTMLIYRGLQALGVNDTLRGVRLRRRRGWPKLSGDAETDAPTYEQDSSGQLALFSLAGLRRRARTETPLEQPPPERVPRYRPRYRQLRMRFPDDRPRGQTELGTPAARHRQTSLFGEAGLRRVRPTPQPLTPPVIPPQPGRRPSHQQLSLFPRPPRSAPPKLKPRGDREEGR